MITVNKFAKFAAMVAVGIALCLGTGNFANAAARPSQHKASAKKAQPQEPPLPSGPTGRPVPQIPLDSMAPVPPQVSYQNGQLTIVAPNSTLGDILRAVRKQTGADIDIPAASDRVVTHLGPGPAQDVLAELLNGSRFNYVLLGSPADAGVLTRVLLVPKSPSDNAMANNQPAPGTQQPAMAQAMNVTPQDATDTNDADVNDDSNANMEATPEQQPSEADQSSGIPTDQPQAKTPQQMLQEMQQRQLQFQQQQQALQQQQQQQDPAAQPPVPTPIVPQRPQQEQQ